MTDIEDLSEKLFILAATARDPELYWESIESIAIWSFHAAEAFTRFKNSRLDDAGGANRDEEGKHDGNAAEEIEKLKAEIVVFQRRVDDLEGELEEAREVYE